jgi:hypothetical protein
MTSLPQLIDTVSTFGSREAAIVLLLPLGGWLLPTGIVRASLGEHGADPIRGTLIITTPANGHHYVAADVAPSFNGIQDQILGTS